MARRAARRPAGQPRDRLPVLAELLRQRVLRQGVPGLPPPPGPEPDGRPALHPHPVGRADEAARALARGPGRCAVHAREPRRPLRGERPAAPAALGEGGRVPGLSRSHRGEDRAGRARAAAAGAEHRHARSGPLGLPQGQARDTGRRRAGRHDDGLDDLRRRHAGRLRQAQAPPGLRRGGLRMAALPARLAGHRRGAGEPGGGGQGPVPARPGDRHGPARAAPPRRGEEHDGADPSRSLGRRDHDLRPRLQHRRPRPPGQLRRHHPLERERPGAGRARPFRGRGRGGHDARRGPAAQPGEVALAHLGRHRPGLRQARALGVRVQARPRPRDRRDPRAHLQARAPAARTGRRGRLPDAAARDGPAPQPAAGGGGR